ncbi:hypothetical protein [Bifidobacterium vansinderenii]|uniref:Single-stranded DNA-binding protein n=1 Tax=Bifidobacterium vansinderenii TaxID=1984871 RepID=A0A229VYA3_9BIFI|nr:hypothetical protein [Bifidobacterium vansinderenii]OXN00608.1 hypothetical protein Tam10B_1131 [Bifidobacterium vansinderenii]
MTDSIQRLILIEGRLARTPEIDDATGTARLTIGIHTADGIETIICTARGASHLDNLARHRAQRRTPIMVRGRVADDEIHVETIALDLSHDPDEATP